MSRPVSIQDAAILDAARKVFLRHGYKAGTARIAREAGISEGSLFKHFKTKNDLFVAAMRVETKMQDWEDRLMRSVGAGDVRKSLESAGRHLLRHLRVIMPRIMMVRSSGITLAGVYRGGGLPPPLRHVKVLARYFQGETEKGRLAVRFPEAQANAFLGALSHYAFCETFYGYRPVSHGVYVDSLVESIVRTVPPPGKGGSEKTRRRFAKVVVRVGAQQFSPQRK